MKLKDINFMGVNIPKELKRISEETDKQVNMTKDQLEIYNLARDNTINSLEILLDVFMDGETIVFYNPNIDVS